MPQPHWLIPSSDEEATARRRSTRTVQASEHLHLLAERIAGHGLHLVLEDHVDMAFDLGDRHLPPGTDDRRSNDALGAALSDPSAVIVTGGGHFFGLPIRSDRRWSTLAELGRSRATLISSALSGSYYGLEVDGPLAIRYRVERPRRRPQRIRGRASSGGRLPFTR